MEVTDEQINEIKNRLRQINDIVKTTRQKVYVKRWIYDEVEVAEEHELMDLWNFDFVQEPLGFFCLQGNHDINNSPSAEPVHLWRTTNPAYSELNYYLVENSDLFGIRLKNSIYIEDNRFKDNEHAHSCLLYFYK